MTTLWTLFEYIQSFTVSQSCALPLGTSSAGSKDLIFTPLSPAGALPLAIAQFCTILQNSQRENGENLEIYSLTALFTKEIQI